LIAASEGFFTFAFCSCIGVDAAAVGRDARAWRDWDSPSRERFVDFFLFLSLEQFLEFPKVILFLIQGLRLRWLKRPPPTLLSSLVS